MEKHHHKTTFHLNLLGGSKVCRQYERPVLNWVLPEILLSGRSSPCTVSVDNNTILIRKTATRKLENATESSGSASQGELSVQCQQVLEILLQVERASCHVGLLINKAPDAPLVFYVFSSETVERIKEFHDFMLKLTTANGLRSNPTSVPSKNIRVEDLDAIRFEIMYLGKLQLQSHRLTTAFVDDAVDKFEWLHEKHLAAKSNAERFGEIDERNTAAAAAAAGAEELKDSDPLTMAAARHRHQSLARKRCNSHGVELSSSGAERHRRVRHRSESQRHLARQDEKESDEVARVMGFDRNKTGLLQVGKSALTFISLGEEQSRNLEIAFASVVAIHKGTRHTNCSAVFVKQQQQSAANRNNMTATDEDGGGVLFCHLFKCVDHTTCEEMMLALKQARHCSRHNDQPITAYHLLCRHLAQLGAEHGDAGADERALNACARLVADRFRPAEQRRVRGDIEEMQRCHRHRAAGANGGAKRQQLVVVMAVLRRWYEQRQTEHEERVRQKGIASPTFMAKQFKFLQSRAKRSLNSFESLLEKGMAKMHELQLDASPLSTSPSPSDLVTNHHPASKFFADEAAHDSMVNGNGGGRQRNSSSTSSSANHQRARCNTSGSSSSSATNASHNNNNVGDGSVGHHQLNGVAADDEVAIMDESCAHTTGKRQRFYRRIYERVAESRNTFNKSNYSTRGVLDVGYESTTDGRDGSSPSDPAPSSHQIRLMWKRAIEDQIMMNRINSMQSSKVNSVEEAEGSEGNEERCMKLSYHQYPPHYPDMEHVWREFAASAHPIDPKLLKSAAARGVPKQTRLVAWKVMVRQHRLAHNRKSFVGGAANSSTPDNREECLEGMLKMLTVNQHAILIDIGRTFPKHPYFSRQLGKGQIELFKLLKAYSLADRDTGYCQGLSFVAGLILLHTGSTAESFDLIKYLMMELDLRGLYLPDMSRLHLCVYQLARLIHDLHPDLHAHLETTDVTLLLFAAPWFLTMFASVLPFGLTARIFDLIFLEGIEALFKAALCLLEAHKSRIMERARFEDVCEYLKDELPSCMDDQQAEQVIEKMYALEVGDRLRTYEIEYWLLREAEEDQADGEARFGRLAQRLGHVQQLNRNLLAERSQLNDKLEAANIKIASLQQAIDRLLPDDPNHPSVAADGFRVLTH